MYSTVLIPTDGSEGAERAVEVGLALASRYGAAVHALFVVDERFVMTDHDMAVEAAEREAERALDRAGDRGTEVGLTVEKHLRTGVPHEEIVRAAGAYDADLVVMGRRGRTGLGRVFNLGSVTDRVVRASPVQVLTVPVSGPGRDPDG